MFQSWLLLQIWLGMGQGLGVEWIAARGKKCTGVFYLFQKLSQQEVYAWHSCGVKYYILWASIQLWPSRRIICPQYKNPTLRGIFHCSQSQLHPRASWKSGVAQIRKGFQEHIVRTWATKILLLACRSPAIQGCLTTQACGYLCLSPAWTVHL